MEMQWADDEELAKRLEQGRMEGSYLKAEAKKVPEKIVHERMCQVEGIKGTKEKKKVKGCSTEDMSDNPSSAAVEDTEELIVWRS